VKHIDHRQGLRGPHVPHRLPEVALEILRGGAQRRLRRVRPPVYLIGSAPDCDLVLGDPQFPAVHTYLYVTSMGVSVRYLGEGPLLRLNGEDATLATVGHGDRLAMGGFEFQLHVRPTPGGDKSGRPRQRADEHDADEPQYDPEWQHLQLLLCDLPAPLRPLDLPGRRAVATDAGELYFERRAIA
jgi:hypothetical protein